MTRGGFIVAWVFSALGFYRCLLFFFVLVDICDFGLGLVWVFQCTRYSDLGWRTIDIAVGAASDLSQSNPIPKEQAPGQFVVSST